jgi:DNA-binding NarL/FixJ family response regulator
VADRATIGTPTHSPRPRERAQLTAMPSTSVLVVDDHPALRAGLRGLLEQEPGMTFLGAVAEERRLAEAVARSRPDVVVLDYALGHGDGLSACFRLKQRSQPPAVVLYSGYVDDVFAVPAAVAQADAIVPKSAPVEVLLDAIRAASTRQARLPAPDPELIQAASSRVGPDDLPVIGMLFARVPVREIADTLDTTPADVRARALRIIAEMQATDRVEAALVADA